MSELIDREALRKKLLSWDEIDPYEFVEMVYHTIDSAPTVPASPWHRVEEPPTQEGKYLVCDEMNNFYVVWWGPILGWCYDPKRFHYWMPIEPPREDEYGN